MPDPTPPDVEQPKLHDMPEETPGIEKNGYKKAREDIETPDDLKLVENFIGNIYGEAKRIDSSNVAPNEFTKGLKFDAKQEILNLRRSQQTQSHIPQPPVVPPPPVQQAMSHVPPPAQQPSTPPSNYIQPPTGGDSLILKHEIDQIKEQVKDIKRLYDEFFKLKQVKGHWVISVGDKKTKTTTVAKTWNMVNKMLKNKTTEFTITYTEDE